MNLGMSKLFELDSKSDKRKEKTAALILAMHKVINSSKNPNQKRYEQV